jgi:hypothetical protein
MALCLAALIALAGPGYAQEVPEGIPDPAALVESVRQQLDDLTGHDLAAILGTEIPFDLSDPSLPPVTMTLEEALAPLAGRLPFEVPGMGTIVPVHLEASVDLLPLALLKTMDPASVAGLIGSPGLPAIPAGLPAGVRAAEGEACTLVDREVEVPGWMVIRICISVGALIGEGLPELPGVPDLPEVPGVPELPELPGLPGGVPGLPPVPTDPIGGVTDIVDDVTGGIGTIDGVTDVVGGVVDTVTGLIGL